MTPEFPRPHLLLARTAAQLAAVALGVGLALSAPAQDDNPGDCAADEKESCSIKEQDAAPAMSFDLDWAPLEAVPESLRDRQCLMCGGSYLDPLVQQKSSAPVDSSEVRAHANSSELRDNEVILTGEANAVQGDRHMRSDKVVFDRDNETATLSGNVTLREPGVLLLGDNAQINSKSGEAVMYDTRFALHEQHMRGTADILARDSDGVFHIHDGNFTYCAPGDNDWAVLSNDLDIDLDEGLATAHHAILEVKDFPVFYTPWLRLPLDDRRRTGLLWPDIGNDGNGGLDISQPIYFNLAPNYDALYAPRYIEERGLDNELQLRYLNPIVGHWTVGGAYMQDDKRYREEVPDQQSADRWLGVVKQEGLFDERWSSRVDYSKASDVDYMKDLETANIDAQRSTSLLQLMSMDYLGDHWLMNLRAQQFQSLADDIRKSYEELPQFTNQYRSDGTPFTLEPIVLAQYSNFGAQEDVVTGQRLYGEAGVDYPMLWRFGSLKPMLKYRQVTYELNEGEQLLNPGVPAGSEQFFSDTNPSAGSAVANLDGSLVFERQTSFAGKELVQTLEPRLYYLYSEHENQANQPVFDTAELTFSYYQLFRDTRFAGHDRLDDANQISAGVTSRFIDDETGHSLLSASVGQIYYFEDRKVQLFQGEDVDDDEGSEIAGELSFNPTEHASLRSSLVWDPYAEDMNSSFFEASYKTDNGSLFNLGYAFLRPQTTVNTEALTEQASASSFLPLNNNWSVFAAMNYSLQDNLSVEDMVGVEYDTCCWTVRLLQLRYYNNNSGQVIDFSNPDLEREQTFQFQVVLKGMGGFGNRISNIMQDMIRGYEERGY